MYFVDSMIVLGWIRSQARLFKTFVSARIGEIQSNSDPAEWKHIAGEENVADDVSRGIPNCTGSNTHREIYMPR